jgi:hypothetical protein
MQMGECPKHQLPSHQLLGFTLEKQTNATINDQLGTQYYPVPLPILQNSIKLINH